MEKGEENIEMGEESFNLFIEKLSLIIIDTVLEESGLDNESSIRIA